MGKIVEVIYSPLKNGINFISCETMQPKLNYN